MRKEIYTCDACNKEYQRGLYDRHPSNIGWTEINGYWICPDHEIKVDTNNGGYLKFKTEVTEYNGAVLNHVYKVSPEE